MNNEFKLAMQLTMVDMLSGAASIARKNILSMGAAGKEVARDFDIMQAHITRGLKAVAVARYAVNKIKPGVADAAELQENMIEVRMALMRSGKDANTLNNELKQVRATAVDLQKITPFSSSDVVQVQKELLTSGLDFNEVVGRGATRAAMMLATITKASPSEASDAMLNVGIPYGLKANEYGELADVIQRHVMSGRLKIPDLNTNLKYIAGVADNLKMPWQDMLTGMAVLGEHGMASNSGIEFAQFLSRMTGTSREERKVQRGLNQYLASQGKMPLKFWDAAGKLKPMLTIIQEMRAAFDGMTDERKGYVLKKIFAERGNLAAMAFMKPGTGSWEFIKDKVDKVAGAEDKMTESLKGYNRSVTSLAGSMKSTAASFFDPWLDPLAEVANRANTAVAALGKFAEAHPKTTDAGNGLLAAGIAVVGGYGAYKLLKGAMAGKKVLGGLGGLKGLSKVGLGIAEGKAVQAATGVTPVFVTNWSDGPGSSVAGIAADVAGGAAGGSATKAAAKKGLGWLAKSGMGIAISELAGGLVTAPVAVGAAGLAGGYGIGKYGILPLARYMTNWRTGSNYTSDGWIGEQLYDAFHKQPGDGKSATKNEIQLVVQIDGFGRVISNSNDMNTQVSTAWRGNFFEGMMTGH